MTLTFLNNEWAIIAFALRRKADADGNVAAMWETTGPSGTPPNPGVAQMFRSQQADMIAIAERIEEHLGAEL